jgi:hypothetical protein
MQFQGQKAVGREDREREREREILLARLFVSTLPVVMILTIRQQQLSENSRSLRTAKPTLNPYFSFSIRSRKFENIEIID